MTLEVEKEIVARYAAGEKAAVLKREYNIAPSVLYAALRKNNVPLQNPNMAAGKSKAATTKCPYCKTTKNPKGALFCCMCGKDIRSESEICIEHLGKALSNCLFLPENLRDETTEAIREAMAILRK